MAASLVGGTLSDTIGHRRTFLLGLTGVAVGSVLFLTRLPLLVILIWSYVGFALGLRTVGGQAYLLEAARPGQLGALSALYTWGMTLGGALGNLVAGPAVDRCGFASYGYATLAFSLAATSGVAFLLPKIRRPSAGQATSSRHELLSYGDLVHRPEVVLLGLLRFLPTCYWGVATVFIPLWIYGLTGGVALVAWYGTISQVVASLVQWLVGRVSDRVGRRIPTVGALAILVVAIVGLGTLGGQLWSLYLFGTLAASAAWSLSALMPGLVSDIAISKERGRVLGFLHLLWNGGMLVGSLIGGILFTRSAALPFQVVGALNVVAVLLALRFFRIAGPNRPPTTDSNLAL